MFDAVKRIQGLPEAEVRQALQPYLAKTFGSATAPQAMRALMDSSVFGWGNRAIQLFNGWRAGKAV